MRCAPSLQDMEQAVATFEIASDDDAHRAPGKTDLGTRRAALHSHSLATHTFLVIAGSCYRHATDFSSNQRTIVYSANNIDWLSLR